MKINDILNLSFLILFFIYLYFVYKKGTNYKTDINKAFEILDVYLEKRYNLIGDLLTSIKSSFEYEQMLMIRLKELIKYDYLILTKSEKLQLNSRITTGLEKLFACEGKLEFDRDFMEIKEKIDDLNDTIEKTRKTYNSFVNKYNGFLQKLPHCIFTVLFNFNCEEIFENISNKIKNEQDT